MKRSGVLGSGWCAALLVLAVGCGEDSSGGGGGGGADAGPVCTDGQTRACDANGMPGSQTCTNGAWGDCVPQAPEQCNGLDDDGDGESDENLQRACNTACGSGIETCPGGSWVGCDAPEPATEVCDGQDNDCDGQIDEALTRVCESACGQGMETCSLGNWVGCDAATPAAETCNGMDDDCDGMADEELRRECSNECGAGAETCTGGTWGACDAREPMAMEDCGPDNGGNDIDDDCDGMVDEGCDRCIPDSTTVCSVDRGVCQQGVQTCMADRTWGPCLKDGDEVAEPDQNPEVCDGLDNDCDGVVDDGVPGAGDACGTDEGTCRAGILACVDGMEACQGEIAAGDELCDGADNDCDGTTDEGLPGDQWEMNEECRTANNVGDIGEGDEPRLLNGSIYPDGDIDYHWLRVDEKSDFCFPGIGGEEPYRVVVALGNLPEGTNYRLCLSVAEEADDINAFCGGELLLPETCTEEVVDGALALAYEVDAACFFNDDTHVLVKVEAIEGSSCLPYTLAVGAETVAEPDMMDMN